MTGQESRFSRVPAGSIYPLFNEHMCFIFHRGLDLFLGFFVSMLSSLNNVILIQ